MASYDLDRHVQRVLAAHARREARARQVVHDQQLELFEMARTAAPLPLPRPMSKGLVVDDEGLFSRRVKTHSILKARSARAYAEIVGMAMGGKRRPIWWVELFAGPGRLWIKETDEFVAGSPIEALTIRRPFDGYVFADLDPACVESLRRRVGDRATVLHGDANGAAILDAVASIVPRDALLVLYSDPEGLDTDWTTLKHFIDRYDHLDLLLNLPIAGLVRAIIGGYTEKAGRMIDAPNPGELIEPWGPKRGMIVRQYFRLRLEAEGFTHTYSQTIKAVQKNVALYDLLLASRHPLAEKFFRAAVDASDRARAA